MNAPDTDSTAALAAAIAAADRAAIAQALNLLDDRRPVAREQAAALLGLLQRDQDRAGGHLIGITGPPGAGKSTLSAALIRVWRRRGLRVAVLAVDPSSPLSGGALLGDRLRMQTSAEDDGVFVRSLSNRGQFGGLSAEVWPMSVVMLAGFDIVLIETVGVGQREVDVSRLCDTTCYVAQPGSGDSVQFLKAGILEVPHILVVNKADMGAVATRTLSELSSALKRTHPDGDWQVPVLATSAASDDGVEALADALEQHYQLLLSQQRLSQRRRHYQSYWLHKRLLEEFGSFGIERLGGEQQLLAQIESQPMNLYHQYQTLRQRLYTAFHDINS
ncbi:MAG: methylmalonyl Co-A mutase-associated GTPase MeaB [Halioglobus sp.]|nr:methylmalonyl Co-A mutase-associated GTPase MeaB [Halioglobus sp.]